MPTRSFAWLRGFPAPRTLQRMQMEALGLYARARRSVVGDAEAEPVDDRGGNPARALRNAIAGPAQRALFTDPATCARLSECFETPVVPSGDSGTYSYYVEPGDFLDLHRDVLSCDITVLTCLFDNAGAEAQSNGQLAVYPTRLDAPLSEIRRDPLAGREHVHIAPGQTLAILGGVLPHALLPIAPGRRRVVSIMCFLGSW